MLNDQNIKDRVRKGKRVEADILTTLKAAGPIRMGQRVLTDWREATAEEDMRDKIDAWVTASHIDDPGLRAGGSVQIKFRESGSDLGIACVRPYIDQTTFRRQWEDDTVPWDRDMVTEVNIYVVKVPDMGLVVAPAAPVKAVIDQLIEELADEPGFKGSVFRSDPEGVELRFTTDKGKGYSHGQRKIIAYITPHALVKMGGVVVQGG